MVDVATGKPSQLTSGSLQCPLCTVDPQFTPDGSSIIYTGCPASSPVARTVPVTGGKSTIMLGPGEGPGGLDGWYVSAAGAWCSRSSGGYEQVRAGGRIFHWNACNAGPLDETHTGLISSFVSGGIASCRTRPRSPQRVPCSSSHSLSSPRFSTGSSRPTAPRG